MPSDSTSFKSVIAHNPMHKSTQNRRWVNAGTRVGHSMSRASHRLCMCKFLYQQSPVHDLEFLYYRPFSRQANINMLTMWSWINYKKKIAYVNTDGALFTSVTCIMFCIEYFHSSRISLLYIVVLTLSVRWHPFKQNKVLKKVITK